MKKYFLNVGFLCLCAGFVFVGCNKDDDDLETSVVADNKITVTVDAPNVAVVKARMDDYEGDGDATMDECDYSNGGFALTLPATLDAEYLEPLVDVFPSGISVSDKNTKMGDLLIYGHNADGASIGAFYYGSNTCNGEYTYVDRNVTITGSYTDGDGYKTVFNVSLVKGWNIVYSTETEKICTVTTSNPGGLSWYFESY
ncbi:MAG: hypothetical protein LBL24_10285 [Bacteroidales bacterium]|jgi:hypothetical protein|nr:hypothetical protein [Bacteroidales bacterium]